MVVTRFEYKTPAGLYLLLTYYEISDEARDKVVYTLIASIVVRLD